MRKKVFLGLFVVFLMFFVSCSHNPEKAQWVQGVVEETRPFLSELENGVEVKTSVTFNDIETKMLKWEDSVSPARGMLKSYHSSDIWFLYPAERVPDNIKGCKIDITYRIVKLKNPTVVYVLEIKTLSDRDSSSE